MTAGARAAAPPALLRAGPALLFAAACAFGVLEVHGSADTWVALGVGQRIAALGEVPRAEVFSYTAAGQPWVNQNWLAHLGIYWIYAHVSPAAVVWATWLAGIAIFAFVALAGRWRSGSRDGALVAAALAALGCRDFLSPRPATLGLLLLAALMAMLAALDGDGGRRRLWPTLALVPILVLWGATHGSFVFGYALLGLWAALALAAAVARRRPLAAAARRVAGVAAVTAAALVTTAVAGPFGIANFLAGSRAGGSSAYRQVSEWLPPWDARADFPPMARFWWLLAAAAAAVLFARWLAGSRPRPRGRREAEPAARPDVDIFGLAVTALTLAMTLWARRFAPLFYICGAPPLLALVAGLARRAPAERLAAVARRACAAALLGAAAVAAVTALRARADLVARHAGRPELGLLERVTRYDATPVEALEYLRRNGVEVDLLVEWQWSGAVMFAAPNARVFMDARAQQAYDELDYLRFGALMLAESGSPSVFLRMLDGIFPAPLRRPGETQGPRTDAVLLQVGGRARALLGALEGARDWVAVLVVRDAALFMRRQSPAVARLGALALRGEEWRPPGGGALVGRGDLLTAADPPRPDLALECWREALRLHPESGRSAYGRIVRTLAQTAGTAAAAAFVREESERLARGVAGLDAGARAALAAELDRQSAQLAARGTARVAPQLPPR